MNLDLINIKLLCLIRSQPRQMPELAKLINRAKTPTYNRLKRLRNAGYIHKPGTAQSVPYLITDRGRYITRPYSLLWEKGENGQDEAKLGEVELKIGLVQAAIFHWDEDKAKKYAKYVRNVTGVDTFLITDKDHETVLLNQAIDICEAPYLWFLTPDVALPYMDILDRLLQVMQEFPRVGVVLPNRQNDVGVGGLAPYKKYLADGTAMLYRVDCTISKQVWFDEEFIFTGWNDLDFGSTVEAAGYEVWVDPRTAVHKKETAYGSFSWFRMAYNIANRLHFEAKWYWYEGEWPGLWIYNQFCPRNKRIPTAFDLAWWPEEKLKAFVGSIIEMEHPQILIKDGGHSGNIDWSFSDGL
jgi:DNA-binding Lrp family transcriptional regulator